MWQRSLTWSERDIDIKKILRYKNVPFNLIRALSLKSLLLWATWFWEGCQNCLFCVQCMFMKKNHFENFIFASSFLDFQRKINGFVANSFLKGFSRMHSTCPDERLEEKTSHFSKILYFLSFSHFEPQMFRTNGLTLPGTVVKTVCYVSRGNFWRKFFSILFFYHQLTMSAVFLHSWMRLFRPAC